MFYPVPRVFNWVKARAECSVGRIFLLLSEVVESDVKAIMELPGRNGTYQRTRVSETKFAVSRTQDFGGGIKQDDGVIFERASGAIVVTAKFAGSDERQLFSAKPSLEPNGDCRLEVNDESLELWQVSRKALEDLFFGK